jgi:GDP-mannose 6-dehydrogenase
MKVSIFGLGYVGTVTAGCLAELGHEVIGVDVQQAKVAALQDGVSPIVEPELSDLLVLAHDKACLSATQDAVAAISQTELSIVCVGTPARDNGRLNLDHVRAVTEQLAQALTGKQEEHIIVYRSTMLPGSVRMLVADYLSQLKVQVYYCPEFLREGSAVADFRQPALRVIGCDDKNRIHAAVSSLFGPAEAVPWEQAEMLKYACNCWHATKVVFANEMGRMAKHLGLDGAGLMQLLCEDKALNISSAYLKPGNAYGGSCLPKDVSALSSLARMEGLSLPLLESLQTSNEHHVATLLKCVTQKPGRRVGLLGLSFKADTDDLRGSPMVTLAETLLGRGYELSIYDPHVDMSRLVGANQSEINRRLPHLTKFLRGSTAEMLLESDTVVVAHRCAGLAELAEVVTSHHHVVDAQGWPELSTLPWQYEGVCW